MPVLFSFSAPSEPVLDDEVDITQLLVNYLRGHGYRVKPEHGGRSLMELMAVDSPALVLLDPGLPGLRALSDEPAGH